MLIRQMRTITPHPATDESIGRWLWALDDSRARTKGLVAGLTERQLDTVPAGLTNSIGTLLYHIALIEADYLCVDVLGMGEDTLLDELMPLFTLDVRDDRDRLSVMAGISVAEHFARLDRVREAMVKTYSAMTLTELDSTRELVNWGSVVSPAWVIYHLTQHEAEHRGEIRSIITLLEQ